MSNCEPPFGGDMAHGEGVVPMDQLQELFFAVNMWACDPERALQLRPSGVTPEQLRQRMEGWREAFRQQGVVFGDEV